MSAKIFPAAELRLMEIWDYTFEKWGEDQADSYVRELIEAIHALHAIRVAWRCFPDSDLAGLWCVRHKHHFIFFRELSGGVVGVITVLHASMDIPARIRDACSSSELGEM